MTKAKDILRKLIFSAQDGIDLSTRFPKMYKSEMNQALTALKSGLKERLPITEHYGTPPENSKASIESKVIARIIKAIDDFFEGGE